MGKRTQESFTVTEALSGYERQALDGQVRILLHGRPVLGYSESNPVARDFVISTLLDAGLQGKSVAKLCAMSAAHVTGVRQRVAAGGVEALAVRGRPGRAKKLTARKLTKLRKLHAQGLSLSAIGRELGVHHSTVARTLDDLGIARVAPPESESLPLVGGAAKNETVPAPVEADASEPTTPTEANAAAVSREDVSVSVATDASESTTLTAGDASKVVDTAASSESDAELQPGAELPPGPSEHPSRYAGTVLLAAAMAKLGVPEALEAANARRRDAAIYDARQIVVALACAWVAGFESLESMHERDARGLGVVLGLERSPSVRTAHRAIGDMVERFDPIALGTGLMRGLRQAGGKQPLLFGVDGHFKEYTGDAPIDKGWNAHKRMATKGLAVVLMHDLRGMTWMSTPVAAGDALSKHVLTAARKLRQVRIDGSPIVLGFDRGGFCFETLNALAAEGFGYVAWVPAQAKVPPLSDVAPPHDGVGGTVWEHERIEHRARLVVERDGEALLPVATNLGQETEPAEVVRLLRLVRGWNENSIKAARASTHIDRLSDRGVAREQPDDRLVDNPERRELRADKKRIDDTLRQLDEQERAAGKRTRAIGAQRFVAELEEALVADALRRTPTKLPRIDLEPDAKRAWLRTKNRSLLLPLKLAADNARRWLLVTLGAALAPTDHDYDATAMPRTLAALLRAPGTARFDRDRVVVTLDLPLPPTAHARLDEALRSLDEAALVFPDKCGNPAANTRQVVFRLAARPTRASLPHARAAEGGQ